MIVETENSCYHIDEELSKYKRYPKDERIQLVISPRLEYDEWLDYKMLMVNCNCDIAPFSPDHLHIWAPDSILGIYTSPIKSINNEKDGE